MHVHRVSDLDVVTVRDGIRRIIPTNVLVESELIRPHPATIERAYSAEGIYFRIGNGSALTAQSHAEVVQGLDVHAALRTAR